MALPYWLVGMSLVYLAATLYFIAIGLTEDFFETSFDSLWAENDQVRSAHIILALLSVGCFMASMIAAS